MSAPAITSAIPGANAASANPLGAVASKGGAGPGAGGAVSGFEALMAALMPQAGDAGVAAKGDGLNVDPSTAGADKPDAGDGADAAAALLAAGLGAPNAQIQPAPQPAPPPDGAPAAWGRDKMKGVPAAPALLHANPKANLDEKAEAAGDAAADTIARDDARPNPVVKGARPNESSPLAGLGRSEAPPAPATAAAAVAPQAAQDIADAPRIVTPTLETQAETAAAAQPETPALTAATAEQPAAHTQAPPSVRGPRADRKGAARETDAVERPAGAPAKTGLAHAAEQAAEPASDKLEAAAAEPKPSGEARTGDATDASAPADARAAAQSQAPAASASHVVRGSPETVANLAAQIVKKLGAKTTRFDVELDPMGLGKVDVRVEIGAQGRLTAAMTFDNPQAAQDVKARATELQRALEQAGFDISGGISFDVASDRGQQQQQQQQAWDNGEGRSGFRGQAFKAALDTASGVAETAMNGALRLRRGITAGLDLRI